MGTTVSYTGSSTVAKEVLLLSRYGIEERAGGVGSGGRGGESLGGSDGGTETVLALLFLLLSGLLSRLFPCRHDWHMVGLSRT